MKFLIYTISIHCISKSVCGSSQSGKLKQNSKLCSQPLNPLELRDKAELYVFIKDGEFLGKSIKIFNISD